MKVKLIKVNTYNENRGGGRYDGYGDNYEDDYDDVRVHVVSETTPWTEIDDNTYNELKEFIQGENKESLNGYYALIKEDQPRCVSMAIEDMKAKAEQKRLEHKKVLAEIERKRKEKEEAAKRKKLLAQEKSLEKKRQTLEKLKKELGES